MLRRLVSTAAITLLACKPSEKAPPDAGAPAASQTAAVEVADAGHALLPCGAACDAGCSCGGRRACVDGACAREPRWKIAELAIGDGFACVRYPAGVIHCGGKNDAGQVGRASPPSRDPFAPAPTAAPGPTGVHAAKAVVAGKGHACALAGDGVWCWGAGDRGQLGRGDAKSSPTPMAAQNLPDAVMVAAGGAHTCALKRNGVVGCWGANDEGQLGDGSRDKRLLPVGVLGLEGKIKQLALGKSHSCALLEAGEVRCWGANAPNGKLTSIVGLGKVDEIAAAESGTCARSGSVVRCWGGAWGTGVPGPRPGLTARHIVASPTADVVCAETTKGQVTCFTPTASRVAFELEDGGAAVGLAAGAGAACRLAPDGRPSCEATLPFRGLVEAF